jgi:hypothetical protein
MKGATFARSVRLSPVLERSTQGESSKDRRHRKARGCRFDQQGQGEAAPGRLAGDGESIGRHTGEQGAIDRKRVPESGWCRMLRCQPIIGHVDPASESGMPVGR